MAYGIKVSKPGKNVLTAGIKDLSFTSEANCLKIYKEGEVTISSSGSATIYHNLGYIPLALVFFFDASSGYYKISSDFKIYSDRIVIFGSENDKYYYFILVEEYG